MQRGLAAFRPGRPVTRGWQLLALLLGLVALWLLRHGGNGIYDS